jgi:CBS domain
MLLLKLKFALGMLRHPSQAWRRMREMIRIVSAPSLDKTIPSGIPVVVEVIPITAADELGTMLVEVYAKNPSPYVNGPTTLKQLSKRMEQGIRHFLVVNEEGKPVGAKAFDTRSNLLINSVTVFAFRGQGININASIKLRKLLIKEGHRVFRGNVMRGNTRMQRAMVAAGWVLEPDPNDPELIRGTLTIENED